MRRLVNRSGFVLCAAVLLGGTSAAGAGQGAGAAAVRPAHAGPGTGAAPSELAPASADSTGELMAVAAVSRDDVWAVGCSGLCNGPDSLILHWDGSRWAKVASPDPGTGFDRLTGVTAVSARDVWAVGYACNASNCGDFRTLILHWNGAKWSAVTSPDPSTISNTLSGVSAVSADNVWAAGSYDPAPPTLQSTTLILHWNGTKWSKVAGPDLYVALAPTLYGISAHSATNAWAVGAVCTSPACSDHGLSTDTLILRWNGTKWSKVASPSPGTLGSVLFGVSAVKADDAWAVGDLLETSKPNRALIEHWNGTKWSQVTAANPGSTSNQLQAVSAASPRDIWAAGYQTRADLPYTATLIDHQTGTNWSAVASPNRTTSTTGINFLTGIAAISPTKAVAVGWVQTFTNPGIAYHVLILTWNGKKWSMA